MFLKSNPMRNIDLDNVDFRFERTQFGQATNNTRTDKLRLVEGCILCSY
jgi:hypothetical protein